MNKIKEQVDAIVVFNATDLNSLQEEKSTIIDRLSEGIDKMKEAKVFTEAEIKEVSQYGLQILNARFTSAKQDIANSIRTNFTF